MKTLEFTPTEKEVIRLNNYLFEIWMDLERLELGLLKNKSLKNFPNYKVLVEVTREVGRYVCELDKYSKDVLTLVGSKTWLGYTKKFLEEKVYKVAGDIKNYRSSRFRQNWKDELTEDLEKTEDLVDDIKKSTEIIDKLYQMHDIEPELKEKIEKTKPKIIPEAKLLAIIVAISIGFGVYRILSDVEISNAIGLPTASYILPTAEIVGINLELLYVIVSVIVLSIYALGKLAKKW